MNELASRVVYFCLAFDPILGFHCKFLIFVPGKYAFPFQQTSSNSFIWILEICKIIFKCDTIGISKCVMLRQQLCHVFLYHSITSISHNSKKTITNEVKSKFNFPPNWLAAKFLPPRLVLLRLNIHWKFNSNYVNSKMIGFNCQKNKNPKSFWKIISKMRLPIF